MKTLLVSILAAMLLTSCTKSIEDDITKNSKLAERSNKIRNDVTVEIFSRLDSTEEGRYLNPHNWIATTQTRFGTNFPLTTNDVTWWTLVDYTHIILFWAKSTSPDGLDIGYEITIEFKQLHKDVAIVHGVLVTTTKGSWKGTHVRNFYEKNFPYESAYGSYTHVSYDWNDVRSHEGTFHKITLNSVFK